MKDFVEANTVFLTIAGSNMYGTSTPESDIDKRGVCIPPFTTTLGFQGFEQQEVPGEDTVIYSLKKFMSLAAGSNPNVIELLFAPEDCILIKKPIWDELLRHRHQFISSQAYHTYCGYAHGQLIRIRNHRSWLLNPPKKKPTREDFGLELHGSGVKELCKGVDVSRIDPKVQLIIDKERQYKAALEHYNQYEHWKTSRNPKRAELEAKFTYDTKHASHLIRILRSGYEILTTGTITTRRPDAQELLDIRNGKLTYEKLMEQVETLRTQIDLVFNNKTYVVPTKPDIEYLSNLCAELHMKYYKNIST